MAYENKPSTQVGGAWKKESSKGTKYISGKFENGVYFTIFANDKKVKGSTQPDYRVVMSLDDATEMGLLSKYEKEKQAKFDHETRMGSENMSQQPPYKSKDVILEDISDKPVDFGVDCE